MDKKKGGFLNLHIRLLNGRLFQKLLNKEPGVLYRSEQGKILSYLWSREDGRATSTDIALATGLANNTLTSMIKKLMEQELVYQEPCSNDKRMKFIVLTELGWSQREIGERVSLELADIFYQSFSVREINEYEAYQKRILANLKAKDEER